jgi:hypothetical protein
MAKAKKKDITVAEELEALYALQDIDSQIDEIKIIRGELPLEVQDLEDSVVGLETRMAKLNDELANLEQEINLKKGTIADATSLIKKYEGQQAKVRNNREFDAITKEVEFQNLEIELAEKRIKEFKDQIELKKQVIAESESKLAESKEDLAIKQKELDEIVSETEAQEAALLKKSEKAEKKLEDRLIVAYKKLRSNSLNGLGVVPIQRDSCGGCFNKIPPQRQLDIRMRKKIIVCEHCGRILVDAELAGVEA